MTGAFEDIIIEGEGITVALLVWRRWRAPMPGLVEAIYSMNPGLAALGPVLPVGTAVRMPVPRPPDRRVRSAIKLW